MTLGAHDDARRGADRPTRPELEPLTETQRRHVLRAVDRSRPTCPACGGGEFRVGDALPLGFLFLREPHDTYMVALTCANPACPRPHSGIHLHADELGEAPHPRG